MTIQQQQEQHVRTLSLVKDLFLSFMGKSEQCYWGCYMFTFYSVFYVYKIKQLFVLRAPLIVQYLRLFNNNNDYVLIHYKYKT